MPDTELDIEPDVQPAEKLHTEAVKGASAVPFSFSKKIPKTLDFLKKYKYSFLGLLVI